MRAFFFIRFRVCPCSSPSPQIEFRGAYRKEPFNLPSYHEINSEDLVRVTAVVYDLIGTIANRLV